ncbi:hypothetical protein ACQJBY_059062 [Aegilops geniculata]
MSAAATNSPSTSGSLPIPNPPINSPLHPPVPPLLDLEWIVSTSASPSPFAYTPPATAAAAGHAAGLIPLLCPSLPRFFLTNLSPSLPWMTPGAPADAMVPGPQAFAGSDWETGGPVHPRPSAVPCLAGAPPRHGR